MTAAYFFRYDYTRRSSLLRNSRAYDAVAFEDQGGIWYIAVATPGSIGGIDLYQLGATPDYNDFDSNPRQSLNLGITNTHAIQHHWDGTNNYLVVACAGNDRIAVVQLASTVDFANFSSASIAYRTGIDDCRYIEILDDGTSVYCFTHANDTGEIIAIDLGGGSTTIDFANVSTASLASNTFSAAGAFEVGNIFDDGTNLYLCFGTISNDRLHIAPIGASPTFDFANFSTATSKSQAIPFPIGAKIFDDGTNIYVCCGDFDNEVVRWLQVGTTSIDYANYGTFSSNTLAITGSNPTWLDFLDDGNRRYLVVSTSSSSGSLTFHFFPLGAAVPFASLSSLEEYVIPAADRVNLGRFALIDGNYYFLAPTQTDMRVYPFGLPAYSQTLTNQINFKSALIFSGSTVTLTGTTAKTYFQFDVEAAPTNDLPPGLSTTFSFTRDTESSGTINSGTLIFDQSGHDLTASEGITVASGGAVRLGKKAGPYTIDFTFQNGSTLEVYPDSDRGGSTLDLTNHSFAATTSINVTSGTATVLVPAGQAANISAGSGVTVNQVEVSFSAENFVDGVRYYLAHQQIFTIAAADVTTAANTITLGNDSNGDAPDFASSSPYTLVRIDQTAGATLPTTSPQIIDGGRYYATISGSAITLFVTESDISGTPITISAAGTDSGGSIFTLTAETELANGVVSGGSGLSVSLALSNEARVLRKAGQWDDSSTVTATPLYQQVFSWSTASGIADPQAISVATEVDETHDRIIGLSNIELEGPIENASGAFVTSINPVSDGSSLDTSNSGPYSFALEGRGRIQINANDSDGISNWQDLYIWGVWVSFTEMGIRLVEPTTFSAVDVFNFRFANIEFDNTSSTTLFIVGGNGRSSDGSNFVASTTTGSIVPNALAQGTGAQTETGTSGLTAGEASQLLTLYNATTDGTGATVFSSDALQNAPSGSGATAQEVWEYSGGDRALSGTQATNIAALGTPSTFQADVSGLLTTTAFNSALPTNFSDLAITATTGQVTVGTNNDKTGYSLTQSFPANFASLAIDGSGQVTAGNMRGTDNAFLAASAPANFSSLLINASGHLSRVTLADTTTTNTDMRGTDNALLAASYTAPDNTSIAAVLTDTGTTLPAQISALNNLAIADIETALSNYGASTFDGDLSALATAAALAAVDSSVDAILVDTSTTIPATLTAIQGATFDTATDSLEAIRDRGDSAWITGGGGSGGDDAETIYNYFTASSRADAFKADTSSLLTSSAFTSALPLNFADLAIAPTTGTVTAGNMRGTDNALLAASYTAPDNSGIADIEAAIADLNDLSQAEVQAAAAAALTAYDPPTKAELDAATGDISTINSNIGILLTRLSSARAGYLDNLNVGGLVATPSDGFQSSDRALLTTTEAGITNVLKGLGRVSGVSASQKDATDSEDGFLTTSDGAIAQTIVKNEDGSITISLD